MLARLPGPVSLTEGLNWDGRRAAAFCCLAKVNIMARWNRSCTQTQLRHRDDAETHMNALQELCNKRILLFQEKFVVLHKKLADYWVRNVVVVRDIVVMFTLQYQTLKY